MINILLLESVFPVFSKQVFVLSGSCSVVTILTFVVCHIKILLLSAELPQDVIPYFLIKWKYTKYVICKRVCISEVTNYLFSVYLQIQMFINS